MAKANRPVRRKRRRVKPFRLLFLCLLVTAAISAAFYISKEESFASTMFENIQENNFFQKAKEYIGAKFEGFFDKENEEESVAEQASPNGSVDYEILVNRNNPVDSAYKPENMVNIAESVPATKNQVYLEEQAASSYIAMVAAMEADGVKDMAAVSGFRDYDYQQRIHEAEVNKQLKYYGEEEARRKAAMVVAAPGTSEHQLGLAIDVSSSENGYSLSESYGNTTSYKWLKENSYKYGFIMRYPEGKSDITGVIFEPWHLRYTGVQLAEKIYNSGLSMEEYLGKN